MLKGISLLICSREESDEKWLAAPKSHLDQILNLFRILLKLLHRPTTAVATGWKPQADFHPAQNTRYPQ